MKHSSKRKTIQKSLTNEEPEKRKRRKLTDSEKKDNKELADAHRAWKLYKSCGFTTRLLSEEQVRLLKTHYANIFIP